MSLVDNVSEGLANKGISADKIKEAVSSNSFVSDLSNTVNSMTKEVQSKLTSGANMLTTTLNDLTSSFPDAVSSFFDNANADASPLSDIASTIGEGAKEVDSKLKSISSGSAEAIAQAVSFTTKTVEDTIAGVDTSSLGSDSVDMLSDLGDSALSNIEKATGAIIKESGDLSETIKSVSSSIAGAIRETPNVLAELKQTITEPITSTVNDFVGSFSSGLSDLSDSGLGEAIDSIVDAGKAIGEVGGAVLSGGKEITNAVIDVLPSPVDSWVSKKVDSYISETAADLLNSNINILKYVQGKFSGTGKSEEIINLVVHLGDNSAYPTVSDAAGGSLEALLGTGSQSEIDQLYSIAKSLCGGVTNITYTNFQYNKSLYDVLLQLAASLGMTDLINQLKRCSAALSRSRSSRAEEDNNPYWDERSVSILQGVTNEVVHRGNVDMYRCIQENIGSSQLLNSEEDVKILVTNMDLSNDTSGRKKQVYEDIISELGYTTDSLVSTKVLDQTALLGADICAMVATDSSIVDETIGADTRTLVQAAMYAYA